MRHKNEAKFNEQPAINRANKKDNLKVAYKAKQVSVSCTKKKLIKCLFYQFAAQQIYSFGAKYWAQHTQEKYMTKTSLFQQIAHKSDRKKSIKIDNIAEKNYRLINL